MQGDGIGGFKDRKTNSIFTKTWPADFTFKRNRLDMNLNDPTQTIFVAGHRGMVGSAIVSHLKDLGYRNILTADRDELDLMSQDEVHTYFKKNKIDQIYLTAAKVGGIYANNNYEMQNLLNIL